MRYNSYDIIHTLSEVNMMQPVTMDQTVHQHAWVTIGLYIARITDGKI